MERFFTIGKIVNTQGLKGEVRIVPTTDNKDLFQSLDKLLIEKNSSQVTLLIEKVRFHKQFVIMKFKGIDDINEAEKYKDSVIKILENELVPLDENEYFVRDLYDLEVYTLENEFLCVLKDIILTGANDVYVIKKEGENDLLIPAIKQCIKKVDIENKTMLVELLEGLR